MPAPNAPPVLQPIEDQFLDAAINRQLTLPVVATDPEDDPIVPVTDFQDLPKNPAIELLISRYGGHCSFLKNWKFDSLAEDVIERRFSEAADAAHGA